MNERQQSIIEDYLKKVESERDELKHRIDEISRGYDTDGFPYTREQLIKIAKFGLL